MKIKSVPHFSSHPLNYLGTAATFILLENVWPCNDTRIKLLLNSSTSQAGDVTLSAADLNSTQPSPPQKEEREKMPEIVNGGFGEKDESVSGSYENLHEQLEKKKASLGMSREKVVDADSLDPDKW